MFIVHLGFYVFFGLVGLWFLLIAGSIAITVFFGVLGALFPAAPPPPPAE